MKRILALIVILALVLACAPAASAANDAQAAAERLYSLGLFNGTGKDANGDPTFHLERVPTRAEAITMLVRLLGKEGEALNGDWSCPFQDVADWAKPYVGYAYAHGLAKGYDSQRFGGSDPATAAQYLTFVLRALGYSDETDFTWSRAWEFSDQIAVTFGEYDGNSTFTRGDAVLVSVSALDTLTKGGVLTLLEQLRESGAIHERNEDYAELVTELLHVTGTVSGGWKSIQRSISIPQINMKSADAKRINRELSALWDSSWDANRWNDEYNAPLEVEYGYSIVDSNILSLTVRIIDTWENELYRSYNLYLNGTLVPDEELLSIYGLCWDNLIDRCRSGAVDYYNEVLRSMDSPLMSNQITVCRDMVSNPDSMYGIDENSITVFLSPEGGVGCFVTIPWPTGSGYRIIRLDEVITRAQAKAIALWKEVETMGGYAAMLREAQNMAALGEASVYAYRRISARSAGTKMVYSLGKLLLSDAPDLFELSVSLLEEALDNIARANGAIISENDVVFLLLDMSTAEDPATFAVAHQGFDPNSSSDSYARIYLERWYNTRINFYTTLMTYYYFYDQNAQHLSDYVVDILKLLAEDVTGETIIGSVVSHLETVTELETDVVSSQSLLNALEDAAAGRPAALLKLASASDVAQVRAWSSYVQRMLSEKQAALGA